MLEFLIQKVWVGAQESAFLASSLVMLMLLEGDYFENCCSKVSSLMVPILEKRKRRLGWAKNSLSKVTQRSETEWLHLGSVGLQNLHF